MSIVKSDNTQWLQLCWSLLPHAVYLSRPRRWNTKSVWILPLFLKLIEKERLYTYQTELLWVYIEHSFDKRGDMSFIFACMIPAFAFHVNERGQWFTLLRNKSNFTSQTTHDFATFISFYRKHLSCSSREDFASWPPSFKMLHNIFAVFI